MQFIDDYLTLAFQIDRHFEGFIDSWFCDPCIRDSALNDEVPVAEILSRVDHLAQSIEVGDLPESRKEYLRKQLRAMHTISRTIAGESLSYEQEVEGCFDIVPERIPESQFEAAIATLDRALPGAGALSDRMKSWRDQFVLSPQVAREAITMILDETRRRTIEFVSLPGTERVDVTFVENQPWSGYNWYLGGTRSRVDINTDLPIHAHDLVGLVAHEAYPGHHTEHCLKDALLYQQQGYDEMAVQLINTPECVIHEGIATLAESMIFPGDEGMRWKQDMLYPAIGIESDPAIESAVQNASRQLRGVGGNAALMRHVDDASTNEVIEYLATYSLRTQEESTHRLTFIDDPLWRPYIFTYHVGRDLLGAWLDPAPAEQRPSRFQWLLTSQTTPASLRADLAPSA